MSSNWRMTLMHVKTPADKIGQVCTEKERLTEIKRLSDQETQRERDLCGSSLNTKWILNNNWMRKILNFLNQCFHILGTFGAIL